MFRNPLHRSPSVFNRSGIRTFRSQPVFREHDYSLGQFSDQPHLIRKQPHIPGRHAAAMQINKHRQAALIGLTPVEIDVNFMIVTNINQLFIHIDFHSAQILCHFIRTITLL